MVAIWANDVPCKDIKQEVIKHTIECMVKDNLMTQFADPILDNGPNKVDSDSLATKHNSLQCMNVWRFITEKDYWLCQDCSTPIHIDPKTNRKIHENNGESSNSDLDVEVGSISQEPSSYCSCRTTSCDRVNKQEIEASICQAEIKKQELEFVFQLNLQNQIPTTTTNSNNCCTETQDTIKIKCDYDTKCVHTQTSQTNLNFILTTNQCELIKPCDASIHPKPCSKRISIQESNTVCCDQNTFPKNSKLKIYIYKTMSTDRCTIRDMPNVSNLSLPCKSNQLIVRLFETDPLLLDPCLILLRKRFEKDVNNACSCINDILKKFDDSMIKHFRLNCEIRHGRVDLNLVCKNGNMSKSRWFLARIPTCTSIHKRDSCHKNVESCEKYGEPRKSMEIPIDPVCGEEVKIECCKELEERKGTFYSFCSNDSSVSMESSVSEVEKEKEEEKEVNFVWSREGPKQMEFVLSSKNAISPKRKGKAKVYFEIDVEKTKEHDDGISEKSESFLNEEEEKTIVEEYKSEEVADEKNFRCEKNEIREFVMIGTENELTLCEYDYSSDSLKESILREDQTSKIRDTEKSFSNNEFFSSDNLNQREQEDLCVTNEKIESLKKDYKECHLEDNVVEMREPECSEHEEYLKDTSCPIMKKDISMGSEICTCELRNNTLQIENCITQETNLSECVVKCNFESSKNICQVEDTCKREVNILEKKKNLEEKYSVDSISFVHSNSTKCSCCGKALSSPSDEEISETNKFCTNKTILDSKVQETSNLIGTENISANLKPTNLQYCKFQTSSIISSSPDQCYNTINSNATDSPRSCPNCEQNLAKQFTSEKISDPPVAESLFMFWAANCQRDHLQPESNPNNWKMSGFAAAGLVAFDSIKSKASQKLAGFRRSNAGYEEFETPREGSKDNKGFEDEREYSRQASFESLPEPERPPLRHIDTYCKPECPCLSKRYTIATLACIGFVISFGMRCNMGMAKMAMKNATEDNDNHTLRFNWTVGTESALDSSFFWGYLLTQVPGGFVASLYPANKIFGAAIAISSFLNLLVPGALKVDPIVDMIVQVIKGLVEGVTYPACHGIWKYWAPPLERSRLATLAFCGSYAAMVIGMPLSGCLTTIFGWTASFYFYGMPGFRWK
ncbi:Vesicular glutamate transporter [Apis cerana cerana]|uniref:Vesicular glutamate transporter n=1 Tax=Apis cerana cerana TaxID=94128 RepID=A0A2A3EGA5_APICC|nr:Vesicular glutamate transporter [Apis cerana cerana]